MLKTGDVISGAGLLMSLAFSGETWFHTTAWVLGSCGFIRPYLVGGLEPWIFMTFHIYILGISSSQLLLSPWFFRGVTWSHQPVILPGYYLLSGLMFKQTWSLGIFWGFHPEFPRETGIAFSLSAKLGKHAIFSINPTIIGLFMVLLTSDRIPKTRCFFQCWGLYLCCFPVS